MTYDQATIELVTAYAASRVPASHVDDVVQQVLTQVWQAGITDPSHSYLWVCVKNVAASHYRNRSRCFRQLLPLEENETCDVPAKQESMSRDDVIDLRDALADMDQGDEYQQRQAQCLRWHYLEGYSLQEMADMLGLPLGTIKRTLHEGRQALAQRLDS